jgi:hypothetical protein
VFSVLLLAASGFAEELALANAKISRSEAGAALPGWYEFKSGDKLYLSFFISGFESAGEADKVSLEYEVQAVDPGGTLLAPAKSDKIEVELAPEDKDWRPPVRYEVTLPQVPLAGRHNFRITVRDRIADRELQADIPFEVKSGLDDMAEALAIQEFRFYRSESDAEGVPDPAVFHAGQPIWARFYLTGYKFGPKNLYDVRYGIQVLDAAGKLIFEEPKAASESNESYYPKRRVSGIVAITLDKRNRPGEYVMVISATDVIGAQETRAEFPFRLQ